MGEQPTFLIAGHEIPAPPLAPGLYLVSTPIGNLRDISIRALETLAACDVLACEDTRITKRLLDRYGIRQRPISYHEHNAGTAGPKIMEALAAGKAAALVSDAGTPLVSDPGYRLVLDAREAGHAVIPVPGASAVLASLAASGLPSDDFRFIGFLPSKQKARHSALAALVLSESTVIAFEAPGRLVPTLEVIAELFGQDRLVCVGRELTKRFETIITAPAGEMASRFAEKDVKGEIVILIAPAATTGAEASDTDIDALLISMMADMPVAKAAREAAQLTGLPRSDLYQRCLALKGTDG